MLKFSVFLGSLLPKFSSGVNCSRFHNSAVNCRGTFSFFTCVSQSNQMCQQQFPRFIPTFDQVKRMGKVYIIRWRFRVVHHVLLIWAKTESKKWRKNEKKKKVRQSFLGKKKKQTQIKSEMFKGTTGFVVGSAYYVFHLMPLIASCDSLAMADVCRAI